MSTLYRFKIDWLPLYRFIIDWLPCFIPQFSIRIINIKSIIVSFNKMSRKLSSLIQPQF